ncbi:hypothetical protein F4823DRAFT_611773 [Ustulina deusta]|nr:hypothetical protein F4823DRAFT_611773 [Ustulina deusta]
MLPPGRRRDLPLESSPFGSSLLPDAGVSIPPPDTTGEIDRALTAPNISGGVFEGGHIRNTPLDMIPESNTSVVAPDPPAVSLHQSPPVARTSITIPHQLAASFRRASRNRGNLADLSDDDIRKQFFIPRTAYIEEPGKHTIDASWRAYLESINSASAFLPLRGTERDRYRPIIQEAEAHEIKKRQLAANTVDLILKMSPKGLKDGHDKLLEYLQRASRHDRQRPELLRARHNTHFGILLASFVLLDCHWYLGHRPGDPIVRIRTAPIDRGCKEGDMFYVPELAGCEDGDEAETYNIRVEGVVPFNSWELLQRFTRYAFPKFVQMAIAAVGFDPRDEEHSAHPWAEAVVHMQTSEFREITERDRAGHLKLLRQIWRIKYGTDMTSYPQFLKDQISTSSSSFREMGWLMCKLESESPCVLHHHYWQHCKGLLEDMSGRDASLLAQEYFDITLAHEAEELLEDGNAEDILIYWRNKESEDMATCKVRAVSSLDSIDFHEFSFPLRRSRPFSLILQMVQTWGRTESNR